MSKSDVFHLGLTKNDLQGATLAIIPGNPDRVEEIAALMDKPDPFSHLTAIHYLACGAMVNLLSSALPLWAAVYPLLLLKSWRLGIRTFLRIGTTGAIEPHINVGDVVVTTASVRLDGASLHFAPLEFPAVADFECPSSCI
ncbi:hypothetical protein ACLK17_23915 [Escherichia coli]